MSETLAATTTDKGVFGRAIGIIFSPGSTFGIVTRSPRPAGILLIVCVVIGLATGLPQFTEQGRASMLQMQRQQIERSGRTVTPEMAAGMERFAPYLGYTTIASIFIVLPVVSLLFAAVYWALFNTMLGGTATFKQVLAIVTHSNVIAALGALAAAPIVYFQGVQSMTGPFNLGALAPMLEPGTRLASFLAGVNFFTLWQLVVTAIGLGVLYRRRSTGIAIGLIVVYLGLTAVFTTAFSSFMGR